MTSPSPPAPDLPILVTGAAGFIGARFVESCNRRGIPVISVDRLSAFETRHEHRGIDFGTRLDIEALPGRLASLPVAAIVHMGAISSTTELDRELFRRLNVEYSKMLWEAARHADVPLAYASSAAVYGDGSLGFDDRDDLVASLRPLNPYGESKRLFDLWALEQSAAGRNPRGWSGFRFFNVYGFGERHKGPQASVALHAYDEIRSAGQVRLFRSHRPGIADGHQKRDFISVNDVVEVLWFALTKPLAGGIYNVGTGTARTFLDLVRAVFAATGAGERIDWIDTPLGIRERYQYFTEARMDRLGAAGYEKPFTALETGVTAYVQTLAAFPR
jgi:ADP-L-glycero-D-manno-heptose 6-epimerase